MSQEVTLRPRGAQRLRGPSGKEKPGLPAPGLPAGGGHLRLAQGKREETTRSGATPVTLTLIRVPGAATSPCGKLSLHLQEPPPRATRARPGLSALRLCGPCRGGRATGAPGSPSGWASGACPPSGCARNRTGGTGAGLRPSAHAPGPDTTAARLRGLDRRVSDSSAHRAPSLQGNGAFPLLCAWGHSLEHTAVLGSPGLRRTVATPPRPLSTRAGAGAL